MVNYNALEPKILGTKDQKVSSNQKSKILKKKLKKSPAVIAETALKIVTELTKSLRSILPDSDKRNLTLKMSLIGSLQDKMAVGETKPKSKIDPLTVGLDDRVNNSKKAIPQIGSLRSSVRSSKTKKSPDSNVPSVGSLGERAAHESIKSIKSTLKEFIKRGPLQIMSASMIASSKKSASDLNKIAIPLIKAFKNMSLGFTNLAKSTVDWRTKGGGAPPRKVWLPQGPLDIALVFLIAITPISLLLLIFGILFITMTVPYIANTGKLIAERLLDFILWFFGLNLDFLQYNLVDLLRGLINLIIDAFIRVVKELIPAALMALARMILLPFEIAIRVKRMLDSEKRKGITKLLNVPGVAEGFQALPGNVRESVEFLKELCTEEVIDVKPYINSVKNVDGKFDVEAEDLYLASVDYLKAKYKVLDDIINGLYAIREKLAPGSTKEEREKLADKKKGKSEKVRRRRRRRGEPEEPIEEVKENSEDLEEKKSHNTFEMLRKIITLNCQINEKYSIINKKFEDLRLLKEKYLPFTKTFKLKIQPLYGGYGSDLRDANGFNLKMVAGIKSNISLSYTENVSKDDIILERIVCPLDIKYGISSHFGPRIHPERHKPEMHYGVDMAPVDKSLTNIKIKSIASGRVYEVKWSDAVEWSIRIRHKDGSTSRYVHVEEPHVSTDQEVVSGQEIGIMGGTKGCSTGRHLHLEYRRDGILVNPLMAKHIYASQYKIKNYKQEIAELEANKPGIMK